MGFEGYAESRGYTAEGFEYDDINLQIGERLPDITKFIIVDDSYGYNAIAVAPYAIVSNSYVLFADRTTIRKVTNFLEDRRVDELILYGHVDREVKTALEEYNPEIINKDGDRFENNMEIVRRYLELNPTKQAVLTNGEFIEKEIMLGKEPVIFIGNLNVPDNVREFIHETGIEVGVLIGNELVGAATVIRRNVGISVFVKFAQGARNPQSAISQVEALDMFYLPSYLLNLEIISIVYNQATNQIEVRYRNTVDQAIYFKGTFSLKTADGQTITFGDVDTVFINGQEIKTVVYDIEQILEMDSNMTADVFVIYGESKGSLERAIDTVMSVSTVRILDNCVINLNSLVYNSQKDLFYIEVENVGKVDCYVDAELIDILFAGERVTFGMTDVLKVSPGKKKNLRIHAELEDEDIEDNEKWRVRIYYGERKDNLLKVIEAELEMTVQGIDLTFFILLFVVIILFLLILWKRKKKCKHCGHRNPRKAKHCKKCHAELS